MLNPPDVFQALQMWADELESRCRGEFGVKQHLKKKKKTRTVLVLPMETHQIQIHKYLYLSI